MTSNNDLDTPVIANAPSADLEQPADNDPSPAEPTCSDADVWRVAGKLSIGRMRAARNTFTQLHNPDLRDVLAQADLPTDTIIIAAKGAKVSIVDLDVHHLAQSPTAAEVAAHIGTIRPQPAAWWITHGGGAKLVFLGDDHEQRALAAALNAPSLFTVEILKQSRHPRALSSSHPGATCGPVMLAPHPRPPFRFQDVGRPLGAAIEMVLDGLGLQRGGRYDHDRCPIDSENESSATDCVVVLDSGIQCHRCAAAGLSRQPQLPPGFTPFRVLVPGVSTVLDQLVQGWVHWAHAAPVLSHEHPQLSGKILRRAYRHALRARYGNDPRIRAVFNLDLNILWDGAVWLEAGSLLPTRVDNDIANALPFVQVVEHDRNGRPRIGINTARRARIKFRRLPDYPPIRPVRGISFVCDSSAIPVVADPRPRHRIQLLDDPMPLHEAHAALSVSFPRVDLRYLIACIAAVICGEARLGQPPMMACTGPTGSGKGQIIRLAASFMGDDIVRLPLSENEEDFFRHLGAALAAGHRFLVYDELGKTQNLHRRMKNLLAIGEKITWRPLYQSTSVVTPVRGALFFPCVRFPDFLRTSREFVRRVRSTHLSRQSLDWPQTCGGDAADWHDRSAHNAHIGNSILTHAWRLCHEHDFVFQ